MLRTKELLNTASAGAGNWVQLDYKSDTAKERLIHGIVAIGDTIFIQGTIIENTADITSNDIVDIADYTDDFKTILSGDWTHIRILKTGANGNAYIKGRI